MPDKDTNPDESGKKKPNLNANDFYGKLEHRDVLKKLLDDIQPVTFSHVISLPPGETIKQKHIIFAIIKNLLEITMQRQWNLCTAFGYVYIYNGSYWKQCEKDDIKNFLCAAAIKMSHPDYEVKADTFPDKLLKQFLNDAHLPTREPDKDKVLINLQNGTFEFTKEGWKLREFNPDDFLTYQLPFAYEKEATCPLFDKFLLRVLPDESCRLVVQEFVSYIFTSLNMEKCLFLLGDGGNGKSVFMNVITALIGKENTLT